MRKMVMAALIAAAFWAFLTPGNRAAAMTPAAPAQLGLAGAESTMVQKAAWHRHWRAHHWGARDHWGRRWYWGWPVPWFHFSWPWHGWGLHHHDHHQHHR